ncbi:hypothetical protein LV28_19365 [Pandoraea pnomenusa]|nr:hypothetical protein LV28_19365 [Pandoraea pnomenusa]
MLCPQPLTNFDGQGFFREYIDNCQRAKLRAIRELIGDEIHTSGIIRFALHDFLHARDDHLATLGQLRS